MSSIALTKNGAKTNSNIRRLDSSPLSHPLSLDSTFYATHFEPTFGVSWLYLKPSSPPRFTPKLLQDLRSFQRLIEDTIKAELASQNESSIKYQVFSSQIPNTFSLGGDLDYFREKIKQSDRNSLTEYARDCIDLVYTNVTHFKLPITTISLVQGSALGGGFEAALANDVVISERQCKFGFPEILFNMFPGMGAYQLLRRRIPKNQAEKLILSGRTYSAEELYDIGLVDVLAEEGEGENAVWRYIRENHGKSSGRLALHKAIESVDPLNYGDFVKIVDIWVETALGLGEKDLVTMDFLIRAQQRMD
ncbi:MAG: crotonase/enoyl-CoA hydratase family protein [Arenicellales bacterium]|nr:crotonase/enoyl-CoA hydratase family protein [Arenicellales bacterium]